MGLPRELGHFPFKGNGTHRDYDVFVFISGHESIGEPVVMFCLDGQVLHFEQRQLEDVFARIQVPLLLVGVASQSDLRSKEYIPWNNSPAFSAHEDFLVNILVPWVRQKWTVEASRNRMGIFGFSNGAVGALTLGLRHRQIFGSIVALSLVNSLDQFTDEEFANDPNPRIYLAAGSREKPIGRHTNRLGKRLAKLGLTHQACVRENAGHNTAFWIPELRRAVEWIVQERA